MTKLEVFEIAPRGQHQATVIWMHGLGATNHDFDSVVPVLDQPNVKFVFPAAPILPVTVNGGIPMPAWYDIVSMDPPPLREDEASVRSSATLVQRLIDKELEEGRAGDQIFLAGFSQGAAMALHLGLRQDFGLAGILVLSGYLLLPQRFDEERTQGSQETPILFAHGTRDPIVPHALGKQACERLCASSYRAQWASYEMEHSLCIEEIHLVRQWLTDSMKSS